MGYIYSVQTNGFLSWFPSARRRQQFGGQGRGGSRGGRGRGRGRGRGGRSGGSQRANVTAEDLDAELDAYHDAVRIIIFLLFSSLHLFNGSLGCN